MLRLELTDVDWKTSKRHWNELKKRLITAIETKKTQFIDRVLFESTTIKVLSPKDGSATPIPSIQMMSEIDTELKNDEKMDDHDDHDIKTHATENKENAQLNQFNHAPVKFLFQNLPSNLKLKELQRYLR